MSKKSLSEIDEVFQRLMDEGIIVIGCVGLTNNHTMFSRVMNPEILASILKTKENVCLEINDSLIDNTKHLCKSMDMFIENFCKLSGIPQGRTTRKFKVDERSGF